MPSQTAKIPCPHFFLALQALMAVIRAQWARKTVNQALLRLPSPANHFNKGVRPAEGQALVRLADRCMNLLVWKTSQPCLFRAYVRAVVLRRGGVPVDLNMGLRNMGGDAVYGHCWLTLKGTPYCESEAVETRYPVFLGKNERGIHYWAGSRDSDEMVRGKREEEAS